MHPVFEEILLNNYLKKTLNHILSNINIYYCE